MKTKLALAMVAVLMLGAVGLDFAGKDSHIAHWLRQIAPATVSPAEAPSAGDEPTPAKNTQYTQWLAEAKAIWEEALKFDHSEFYIDAGSFEMETDPEKQFSMLKSMGLNITRAGFDQTLAVHRKSAPPGEMLISHVINQWLCESPREALAWRCNSVAFILPNIDAELSRIIEHLHRHPDFWAAFAEASPSPELANRLRLWAMEFDDPGSIWATNGVNQSAMAEYLAGLIEDRSPEKALKVLLRCPDANFKSHAIPRLAYEFTPAQLLQLANGEFAHDPTLSNLLRAMAGDSGGSYQEAVDSLTANLFVPDAWGKSLEHLYTQWLARDPAAALAHAISDENGVVLGSFMNAAVRSGRLNERALFDSLSQVPGEQRDAALAAFYRAQAAGNPEGALQRIIQSTLIEDQVDAAKNILGEWAGRRPEQAADWLTRLPPGADHSELVAEIASAWVYNDPEAAIAFAQQQGLGLRHGFMQALVSAAGIKADPEFLDLLQPYKDDPRYGQLLVLGWMRNSSADPATVFDKITANATGNWQSNLVEVLTDEYERDDLFIISGNSAGLTEALPTQDLTSVPAEKLAILAQRYVVKLSQRGELNDGLNWTLRLPPAAGELARTQIVAELLAAQPDERQRLRLWLERAPLSPDERQRLLEQVR